jgi:hypothetical protein
VPHEGKDLPGRLQLDGEDVHLGLRPRQLGLELPVEVQLGREQLQQRLHQHVPDLRGILLASLLGLS